MRTPFMPITSDVLGLDDVVDIWWKFVRHVSPARETNHLNHIRSFRLWFQRV